MDLIFRWSKILQKYLFDNPLFSYTVAGDELTIAVSPEAYQQLIADQEFHLMLGIYKSYNEGRLKQRYQLTLKIVLELIEQIEEELERLQ